MSRLHTRAKNISANISKTSLTRTVAATQCWFTLLRDINWSQGRVQDFKLGGVKQVPGDGGLLGTEVPPSGVQGQSPGRRPGESPLKLKPCCIWKHDFLFPYVFAAFGGRRFAPPLCLNTPCKFNHKSLNFGALKIALQICPKLSKLAQTNATCVTKSRSEVLCRAFKRSIIE